jgi:hypothetical protein
MTTQNNTAADAANGLSSIENEVKMYMKEYTLEALREVGDTPDEVARLVAVYASDDIWSCRDLEDIVDRAPECLDALDVYYSTTERRGPVQDTWDMCVDVLEEEGLEYIVSEVQNHFDPCEPLLHTTNRLVNWTGQILAPRFCRESMYEALQTLFTENGFDIPVV